LEECVFWCALSKGELGHADAGEFYGSKIYVYWLYVMDG
jgi:hypothetical protein